MEIIYTSTMGKFLRILFWVLSALFFFQTAHLFIERNNVNNFTAEELRQKAKVLLDQNQNSKAIEILQLALTKDPYYYKVMIELGRAYGNNAEFIKASQWFSLALKYVGSDEHNKAAALYNLGLMDLSERNVHPGTWAAFREAWESKQLIDQRHWLNDQAGPLYYVTINDQKKFEEKAQDYYPNAVHTRYNRLKKLSTWRQYNKILEECDGYTARNPNSSWHFMTLQWRVVALKGLRQYDRALDDIRILEKIKDLSKADKDWIKYPLFEIYLQTEDYAKSLDLLNKLLSDPDTRNTSRYWIKSKMAEVYARMGDIDNEIKIHQELLSSSPPKKYASFARERLAQLFAAKGDNFALYDVMIKNLDWPENLIIFLSFIPIGFGIFLIFIISRLFFIKRIADIQASPLKLRHLWLLGTLSMWISVLLPLAIVSINVYGANFLGKINIDPSITSLIVTDVLTVSIFIWWFKKYYGWDRQRLGLVPKGTWIDLGLPFIIALLLITISALWGYVLTDFFKVEETPRHPMQDYIRNITDNASLPPKILLSILLVMITPIIEELTCRVFIFSYIKTYTNTVVAVVLQAMLFALIHMSPLLFPYYFIFGAVSSLLFLRFGSIYPSIMMHVFINLLCLMATLFA